MKLSEERRKQMLEFGLPLVVVWLLVLHPFSEFWKWGLELMTDVGIEDE